jgi:hypothetical protein
MMPYMLATQNYPICVLLIVLFKYKKRKFFIQSTYFVYNKNKWIFLKFSTRV